MQGGSILSRAAQRCRGPGAGGQQTELFDIDAALQQASLPGGSRKLSVGVGLPESHASSGSSAEEFEKDGQGSGDTMGKDSEEVPRYAKQPCGGIHKQPSHVQNEAPAQDGMRHLEDTSSSMYHFLGVCCLLFSSLYICVC